MNMVEFSGADFEMEITGIWESVPDLITYTLPSQAERLEEVQTHLVTAAKIAAVRLNTVLVDQVEESFDYLALIREAAETGIQVSKWMDRLQHQI